MQKIKDFDKFLSTRKEWNELLSKSDNNTIFLTHEWISAWWESFAKDKSLYILLIRDTGEVIGIAPFMISNSRCLKMPVRSIDFIGYPWMGCLNFIVSSKHTSCIESIISWMESNDVAWNIANFMGMSIESQSYRILVELLRKRNFKFTINESLRTRIYLDPKWPNLEPFLRDKKNLRKDIAKKTKRLRNTMDYSFERYTNAINEEKLIKNIFDISSRSWKAKEKTSIASNEFFRNFYSKLIRVFNRRGELDIHILKVDGKGIAYELAFNYANIHYAIDITSDDEFSYFSPGLLLNVHILENLIKNKIFVCDWGPFFDWKRRWHAAIKKHANIILFNKCFYPNLLYFGKCFVQPYVETHRFSKRRREKA